MTKKRKSDFKEAGLQIELFVLKFFLKSEYLHYGYFTDGLKGDIQNFAAAQQNYTNFLISNIPADVKTILDVGCGSGKVAEELINKGYEVDCVNPGSATNNFVIERLGKRINLYNCNFQDLEVEKQYDLVLFSESFQYIPVKETHKGLLKYCKKNGYVIICDFFHRNIPGKSPMGGGIDFPLWEEELKHFDFNVIKEQDITAETAPTNDIINQLTMEVVMPTYHILVEKAENKFPRIMKFIKWKYRKKLEKLENKHFKGEKERSQFHQIQKIYVLSSSEKNHNISDFIYYCINFTFFLCTG